MQSGLKYSIYGYIHTGIQSVILLLPRKSQYVNQNEKSVPSISLNSRSDSESLTESGRDGGSNASKRLKTAAAAPVCEQNVRFLGSMDARQAADADRRAVCGQRVPGSAPDLHDGTVLLQQSLSRKKPQLCLDVL